MYIKCPSDDLALRSVESVFRFNPFAEVKIATNSVAILDKVEVLKEIRYRVMVTEDYSSLNLNVEEDNIQVRMIFKV